MRPGQTHTDEARRKIGDAQRGKTVTPETREKIAATNRRRRAESALYRASSRLGEGALDFED